MVNLKFVLENTSLTYLEEVDQIAEAGLAYLDLHVFSCVHTHPILERIQREAGVPELIDVLIERLNPTDLQSLLLEVYWRRALEVKPSQLLERYERDRFVRPV